MKVKSRLSLYCSLIFGIIFAIISILIYGLYYKTSEKIIFENLEKTAYILAFFYLEEDELNTREYEKIKKQFEEKIISDSIYQVYNSENRIAYGIETVDIPPSTLEKIRKDEFLPFAVGNYLCYGIFYKDNQGDFVVIVKENKNTLDSHLNLLLWILIPLFLTGCIAIVFLSRWVSGFAYKPFSEIISQVNDISTNNLLDVKIKSPQTKDELQDLTDTFNNLLSKISETVVIQQNFVRYVSHEFKTPLASMLGNLDLFALKDRSPEEYHRLSEELMQQIFQMEEILETLIIISDLKKEERETAQTRVDELIWEIINKIKKLYPAVKILVNIDVSPEDETLMLVDISRTQLLIALFNLIENAAKYSKKGNVEIHLYKGENHLCVSIADRGIGIPQEQLSNIGKPFYRGDNTDPMQGSGIGLSLALRIFDKNRIEYRIESEINVGTKISACFNAR